MTTTPIKGFIIFNNETGALAYVKYFNAKSILSKEVGFRNITFDPPTADPHKIA